LPAAGAGTEVPAAQQGYLWQFVRQEEGPGRKKRNWERSRGRSGFRFLQGNGEGPQAGDPDRAKSMIETGLVERIQAEGLRCRENGQKSTRRGIRCGKKKLDYF